MDIDLTRYEPVWRRRRYSLGHRIGNTLLFVLIVLLLILHLAAPTLGPAVKFAICEQG